MLGIPVVVNAGWLTCFCGLCTYAWTPMTQFLALISDMSCKTPDSTKCAHLKSQLACILQRECADTALLTMHADDLVRTTPASTALPPACNISSPTCEQVPVSAATAPFVPTTLLGRPLQACT